MIFKDSSLAHTLLHGLKGIEIGAAAHNSFNLNTVNVDDERFCKKYEQEQARMCGRSERIDFFSDACTLPFRDKEYDFVISSHVLDRIWRPDLALKEWCRVSKKYIFLIIPQKSMIGLDSQSTTWEEVSARTLSNDTDAHYNAWDDQSFINFVSNLEDAEVFRVMAKDDKVGNGFCVVLKVKDLHPQGHFPANSDSDHFDLHNIGLKQKTDKSTHNFLRFYESHLKKYRYEKIRLLEIGIGGLSHATGLGINGGNSLRMWEEYFPNAEIIGVDIDESCLSYKYESNRVRTIIGSQTDRKFLDSIPGEFDVIIDDGGHTMEQQMITLGCIFKKLKPGGTYILEDLHTSFMPDYGGNSKNTETALSNLYSLKSHRKLSSPYIREEEKKYIQSNVQDIYLKDSDRNHVTGIILKSDAMVNLDNTAIFLHLYYFDLWDEISATLNKCDFKFNLYVNLVEQNGMEEIKLKIQSAFPSAVVIVSPNSGMDIGGQLRLLDAWLKIGGKEDFLVFIHGKKSLHQYYDHNHGQKWRRELFEIISPSKKASLLQRFSDKGTGMASVRKWIFSTDPHTPYTNDVRSVYNVSQKNIDRYFEKLGLKNTKFEMAFVGGTMFWVRAKIYREFFTKFPPALIFSELEANLDPASTDFDTRTHAMERIFGFIVSNAGYKIEGI